MTSCSGLPICLSGIEIFRQHHQRRHGQARPRGQSQPLCTATAPVCLPDGEVVGSELESATNPSTMPAAGLLRDDSGISHEGSSSQLFPNALYWQRLALMQQMADLDCRREAVRRRSLQNVQNSSYLTDYRLSSRQNKVMSACLRSQSKEDNGEPARPWRSAVAKAA